MRPQDADILCCDSELVGQIWNGPDTVLNQKRTQRLFTTAQRRAILARDRGCQAPGCSVPAVYCDIHHIKDWLAGGLTSERNATTLCPSHHAAVHIGNWRIRRVEGLTYVQPAHWLDPYQPLLRNLYWNTYTGGGGHYIPRLQRPPSLVRPSTGDILAARRDGATEATSPAITATAITPRTSSHGHVTCTGPVEPWLSPISEKIATEPAHP